MKEHRGELWDLWRPEGVWVCITTNGYVRLDECAVMGRGCALEAAQRYPHLPKELGSHILRRGNIPTYWNKERLVTFPVKHHWNDMASLPLIRESGVWLLGAALLEPETLFYLPRPGVGNGKRSWEGEVKPLLEALDLPDNAVVVSK